MTSAPESNTTIALVAMPWALFNRPSIQLGALKAYVEENTEVRVSTFHPYLHFARAISINSYNTIADNSWAGEALFAALLFKDHYPQAERLFNRCLGKKTPELPDFATLTGTLEQAAAKWLENTDWPTFGAVGFSVCFNQLLASLYMAGLLKKMKRCPPIIFGGSSCGGELGLSLINHFPEIDYVIDGEGETPLAGLCEYLMGTATGFPDRVYGKSAPQATGTTPEIHDLNSLPVPDYTPYFNEARTLFAGTPFIPTLPLEFSRGCWWNRCTFCNLNLQWCGYRHKSADTTIRELATLTAAHQCLDYSFTDNALPPKEADRFFRHMAAQPADYRFFAEVRAIDSATTLELYKSGGLDTMQVGIESLSAGLLKKMQKGVSVIENISVMKTAMAAGIQVEGNLIVEFPGSTEEEVRETLDNIDYVLPYSALSAAVFFLGHGSPVAGNPAEYGIKAILRHNKNKGLFPPEYLATLTLLTNEYRGDRQLQRRRWQPVKEKIRLWQDFHAQRKSSLPPLYYRDGGTFLIIRQEMPSGPTRHHRLQGMSRTIYLYCRKIRTLSEIQAKFSGQKESALLAFIDQLCQKRVMFKEQDKVLSLAGQLRR